jgi:hypothetical protein
MVDEHYWGVSRQLRDGSVVKLGVDVVVWVVCIESIAPDANFFEDTADIYALTLEPLQARYVPVEQIRFATRSERPIRASTEHLLYMRLGAAMIGSEDNAGQRNL